jgi:hypothetical protein
MRLALLVPLALAAGVTSFAASACDTRADYNNKINGYLKEYQISVDAANKNYALLNNEVSARWLAAGRYNRYYLPRGQQYFWSAFAYDEAARYNLLVWTNAVNKAVEDYNKNAQAAHENACFWW